MTISKPGDLWLLGKHRLLCGDALSAASMEYPDLKRMVVSHASEFGVRDVLIEDKASGTQLLQDLRRDGMHGVKPYQNSMDKVVRLNTVSSTIEGGFVYLPEQAHWLADFRAEVAVFPNGRHDDQVDSMSQALDWFKQRLSFDVWIQWMEERAEESRRRGYAPRDPSRSATWV